MLIEKKLTAGIFCFELKNRFRCMVDIQGEQHVCYVASSSRLSNFIELSDKTVLLLPPGENAGSTDFTLFAVKYRNSLILLNLSLVNAVLEEQLKRKCFSFLGKRKEILKEHNYKGYKADLFIKDTETVIEIKTVLSTEEETVFPTVRSERIIRQLKHLNQLLEEGHRCCMLFVSLSPTIRSIDLSRDPEVHRLFKRCVENGLSFKAFKLKTTEESIIVGRSVELCF